LAWLHSFPTRRSSDLWDDRQRRKEREEDRREREDVAYAAVHAEYFRLWTVSEQWRMAELANPAVVATMSPDDILPRDWASLTQRDRKSTRLNSSHDQI